MSASKLATVTKPTVRYVGMVIAKVGQGAILVPVEHPREGEDGIRNGEAIRTSAVISIDDDTGRVETRNTIYLPQEPEASE